MRLIDDNDLEYEPWISPDGMVGYRLTHPSGEVTYIYFNPSLEFDPTDESNVFVYQGSTGDPAIDEPMSHFVIDVKGME